jgi:hypothetical protein
MLLYIKRANTQTQRYTLSFTPECYTDALLLERGVFSEFEVNIQPNIHTELCDMIESHTDRGVTPIRITWSHYLLIAARILPIGKSDYQSPGYTFDYTCLVWEAIDDYKKHYMKAAENENGLCTEEEVMVYCIYRFLKSGQCECERDLVAAYGAAQRLEKIDSILRGF